MNANEILDQLRELLIDSYDTKNELMEELYCLIDKEYDKSLNSFLEKEVLNEDYGSLRDEVISLYNEYIDYLPTKDKMEKIDHEDC